jgi:hypothetical protein
VTARPQIITGRDGLPRPREQEEQIADLCLAVFHDGAGARLLAHLRNTTLNRVLGPGATDAELRHHEGKRELVATIMQRMDDARANRARGAAAGDGAGRTDGGA